MILTICFAMEIRSLRASTIIATHRLDGRLIQQKNLKDARSGLFSNISKVVLSS